MTGRDSLVVHQNILTNIKGSSLNPWKGFFSESLSQPVKKTLYKLLKGILLELQRDSLGISETDSLGFLEISERDCGHNLEGNFLGTWIWDNVLISWNDSVRISSRISYLKVCFTNLWNEFTSSLWKGENLWKRLSTNLWKGLSSNTWKGFYSRALFKFSNGIFSRISRNPWKGFFSN